MITVFMYVSYVESIAVEDLGHNLNNVFLIRKCVSEKVIQSEFDRQWAIFYQCEFDHTYGIQQMLGRRCTIALTIVGLVDTPPQKISI